MEESELTDGMRVESTFQGEVRTGSDCITECDGSGDSLDGRDFIAFCTSAAPPTPRLRSFGLGATDFTSMESEAEPSVSEPCRLIASPLLKADNGAAEAPWILLVDCVAILGDFNRSFEDVDRSKRLRLGSLS